MQLIYFYINRLKEAISFTKTIQNIFLSVEANSY